MQLNRYRNARPRLIRALVFTAAAGAAFAFATGPGQFRKAPGDPATDTEKLIAILGTLALLAVGVLAVRAIAAAIRAAANEPGEAKRAVPLALLVSVIGYLLVLMAALGALEVPVGRLLLGGALTGIILGIAAQQSLGNFFAGIVLLTVRPFSVGDYVVLKSGPIGGQYEGTVTEMSMFYVHMQTAGGPVLLPNAGVLAAAVGPGARTAESEEETEEIDPGPQHGGTAAG